MAAVVLLSNGEKTLEGHFQEKGLTVKAGQSVRLLQIPIFGKHGAFDELHGMADGRKFSDTLQKQCNECYGTAGAAYLERLVTDTQDFGQLLESALRVFAGDDMQPQELRAARAFALVAVAGELATDYGITCWLEGVAIKATQECFNKWREFRGKGATEDNHILESVRDFISLHGDSRFSDKAGNDARIVHNRAGWYSDSIDADCRVYLFNSAGFKEATKGYDPGRAVQALIKAGWLIPSNKGEFTAVQKIQNKSERVYQVVVNESD